MTIKIAIIGDPFIPSKVFKLSLEKHIKLIKQYGVKEIHRLSFKPIKELINKKNT